MGSGFKTFTAGSILTASDVQNYLQDQAVMVFGGTAARSSAIGTANFEEGMLSYLTDVDKIQVYTGSSWADVYPPASTNQGLTLINTTSFSAVSSFSLAQDTFTSTYDNYKLLFTLSAVSADQSITLRMRKAGTDASGANYSYSWYGYRTNNTSDQVGTTGQTSQNIGSTESTLSGDYYGWQVEIYKPKVTGYTATFFTSQASDGSSNHVARFGGGVHLVSDSYDAVTILASTGTFSGKYSVYGYNL